jgi:DNA repair exonuclease SbcCD ATPase subunit
MYIEFKKITFKNIGGYGDDVQEIEFEKGLSLIIGKNGQGKSTIIQALNYVLYGKSFTKIKLSSLKNKYSDGSMLITLDLIINKENIRIERGLKPTIFNIFKNGKLLPFTTVKDYQEMLVTDILRMSENIFKQLVALGANVENAKHFMELNQKEKEEILQILTDTRIFSLLTEEIRLQKSSIKSNLSKKEIELSVLKDNLIKTFSLLDNLNKQNEDVRNNRDQRKSELLSGLEELYKNKETLIEYTTKFQVIKEKFEPIFQENENNMKNYNIKNAEIARLNSEINLFKRSEEVVCPECGGSFKEIQLKKSIEVDEINITITNLENEVKEIKVQIDNLSAKISLYNEKAQEYNIKIKELQNIEYRISNIKSEICILEKQHEISTEETEKQVNDITERVNEESALISIYGRDINDYEMLENILSIKNITGKIISTQIPLLNTFINEYLEKFEVDYQFFLSKDLKELITRRDEEFEYYSLSNGEKQRIVLSILFSFLNVIEMSVKINILFLDEFLDSSLDEEGTSLVLDILKEDFQEKNVFIISHKQEVKSIDDVAKSIYRVQKDKRNKYSFIEKQ